MIALMITILVIGIAVDAVFAAVDRGSGPAVVSRRADQATTVLRGPRMGKNRPMDISARTDYAVRAMLSLAAAQVDRTGPVSAEAIASRQALPKKFLEAILSDLRRSGLVTSTRGNAGGYALARPAAQISLGDVFRAVDGPLAECAGYVRTT